MTARYFYFVLVSATRKDKPGLRQQIRARLDHHHNLAQAMGAEVAVIQGMNGAGDMHAYDWSREHGQPIGAEAMFHRGLERGHARNEVMVRLMEAVYMCGRDDTTAIEAFPLKGRRRDGRWKSPGTRGLIELVPNLLYPILTVTEI